MKSSELNRLILRNGWKVVRQNGSHITYKKKVFFSRKQGSGKGLETKIKKEMG